MSNTGAQFVSNSKVSGAKRAENKKPPDCEGLCAESLSNN